jgi:uncharacterized membrane protein YraQ (UPF0718 family)
MNTTLGSVAPERRQRMGLRSMRPPLMLSWVLAGVGWWLLYSSLAPAARWITEKLFGLSVESHLGSAVEFFLYETPKVLMLLVAVVFVVGIVRTFFTPERARRLLAGRRESGGNVLAAMLGVVTPFCSCSAVPLFIGFVESGVPLGVTLSFLIAAPMVNEIAIVLLFERFGLVVTSVYVLAGLSIAIVSGWILGRLRMERHVEEWVYEMQLDAEAQDDPRPLTWPERVAAGREAVREIVRKVWPFVVVGIAVGAGIHGYVPAGLLAGILGEDAWWSVPLAVVIGVPMYSNAAGIVPVVETLMEKGASLGSVLAFMMSVIALSLPELVILRRVLKPRLIATFVAVVTTGIIAVGFLFNALF